MKWAKDNEMIQNVKSLAASSAAILFIFAVSTLLTGCEVARYAAKCSITQPRNCN